MVILSKVLIRHLSNRMTTEISIQAKDNIVRLKVTNIYIYNI